MKIYFLKNAENEFEIIGSFKPTQGAIQSLSKQFKVEITISDVTTAFDITRWEMKQEVKKQVYKAIDKNTFEKVNQSPNSQSEKVQIKFDSNDHAEKTISTSIAYIRTNAFEDGKKLIALANKTLEIAFPLPIEMISDASLIVSKPDRNSLVIEENLLLDYLQFIEKITNGTGKITEKTEGQIKQATKSYKYSLPPELLPALSHIDPESIIDNFFAKRKIKKILNKIKTDKQVLAYQWLEGKADRWHFFNTSPYQSIITDCFATHINAFEFIPIRIAQLNSLGYSRKLIHDKSPHDKAESVVNSYIVARTKLIHTNVRNNLLKTILLGLIFLPSLFYTLPKRKELLQQQAHEMDFINQIRPFLKGDRDGNRLKNRGKLYGIGRKLLNNIQPDYAIIFLSQVRPDQEYYSEAMQECAHYYRANGNIEKARYFAMLIDDTEILDSLDRINAPVAGVSLNPDGKQSTWKKDTAAHSLGQLAGERGFFEQSACSTTGAEEQGEKLQFNK